MDESIRPKITTPAADLAELSFCSTDTAALTDWVAALPMANTATAAQQLEIATQEVARVAVTAGERLEMLEIIRQPLHYVCARLDRAALGNSQYSDPLAQAAQQLQSQLCTGYKAVVAASFTENGKNLRKDVLPQAIHRALSDISRTLLRTLQLYVSAPQDMWLELNQLYLLAERLNITGSTYRDSENHNDSAISISDAYLRPVLLATCKPNQLRHQSLSQVFNALEHWAARVFIESLQTDSLFGVDLASDQGPRFARLLGRDAPEPRGIRMDVLVYELEAYLKEIDTTIPVPDTVSNALLEHLVSAWGKMQPRAFRRSRTDGVIKVAVGLRNTHYFLSGGVDFGEQISSTDALLRREVNPFLTETDARLIGGRPGERADVWDNAFDLRVRIPENPNIRDPERILLGHRSETRKQEAESKAAVSTYHFYDTEALDTSPGGFRIHWRDPLPNGVQTGELLAIRDAKDSRWCIAVVRWIQQDGSNTSMGIELLAPRAIPVAARVIMKKGGPTDFTRALLLPELKPINQPATLITPRVPFQEDQKIHIQRQGIQTTAQLQGCQLKTESFNQFTFRLLDGYLENAQINLNIAGLSELIGDQNTDEPR